MKKPLPYQLIWFMASLFILSACEGKKSQQTAESTQSSIQKPPVIASTPAVASSPDTLLKPPTIANASTAKIEVKTFQQTGKGWGYDVYLNGKLYIHQPHIPAIGGNQGFRDEATALKTAKLIEWKIRHNMMPPSITPDDLDSLGVLK